MVKSAYQKRENRTLYLNKGGTLKSQGFTKIISLLVLVGLLAIGTSISARADEGTSPAASSIKAICLTGNEVQVKTVFSNPVAGVNIPVKIIYTDGSMIGGTYKIIGTGSYTLQSGVNEYTITIKIAASQEPGYNPRLKAIARLPNWTQKPTQWFTLCGYPKLTEWKPFPYGYSNPNKYCWGSPPKWWKKYCKEYYCPPPWHYYPCPNE